MLFIDIFNYVDVKLFVLSFLFFFRQTKQSYLNAFVVNSCCNNLSINKVDFVFFKKMILKSMSFVIKFIYCIIVVALYVVVIY